MQILIDPGHGGSDPGCMAKNGLLEKEVTLAVALRLRDVLTQAGASVRMTRDKDITIPHLFQRAMGGPWDAVLALHADTNDRPDIGVQTPYCKTGDGDGHALGFEISKHAPDFCRPPTPRCIFSSMHDWTARAYNVLRHHVAPAVLVEMFFMSNPHHLAGYRAAGGIDALAQGIAAGTLAATEPLF